MRIVALTSPQWAVAVLGAGETAGEAYIVALCESGDMARLVARALRKRVRGTVEVLMLHRVAGKWQRAR